MYDNGELAAGRSISGDLSGVVRSVRRRTSITSEAIAEQMRKELKRKDIHEKRKALQVSPEALEQLRNDDAPQPQDGSEEREKGAEKDREKQTETEEERKKRLEEDEYEYFLLMNSRHSPRERPIVWIESGSGPVRSRSATVDVAAERPSPTPGTRISPRRGHSPRSPHNYSAIDLPSLRVGVSEPVTTRPRGGTSESSGEDEEGSGGGKKGAKPKKDKKNRRKKEKRKKEENNKKEKRKGSFIGAAFRRATASRRSPASTEDSSSTCHIPMSLSMGTTPLSPRTPRGPGKEGMLKLGSLMHLNISHNGLTCIPPEFDLKAMTSLNKLSIEGNAFVTLPDNLLSPLSALATLELSHNKLSDLECVWERTSLSEITARGNHLVQLSQGLGQLVHLKTLDLSDNRIQSLPEAVSCLQSLKTLLISKNKLDTLPSGFSGM